MIGSIDERRDRAMEGGGTDWQQRSNVDTDDEFGRAQCFLDDDDDDDDNLGPTLLQHWKTAS